MSTPPLHCIVTLNSSGKIRTTQLPDGLGGGVWGAITGTLSAQTDLGGVLSGKADTHSHPYAPDTALSGVSKISVGTIQPSTPSVGDLWIDCN